MLIIWNADIELRYVWHGNASSLFPTLYAASLMASEDMETCRRMVTDVRISPFTRA